MSDDRPYESKHGLEQSRRDFMRDYPELYDYIAARAAAKVLDEAGDWVSGHHQAANLIWRRASLMRKMFVDAHEASRGEAS